MNEPLAATVIADLATEVEVPRDGTLSRVLYKDEHVRLVAFAFDTGQELTEHTAAVPAILQVIRGSLRVRLGEEAADIGPGSWVHMPAHLSHSLVAAEPTVMLLTLLRGGSS